MNASLEGEFISTLRFVGGGGGISGQNAPNSKKADQVIADPSQWKTVLQEEDPAEQGAAQLSNSQGITPHNKTEQLLDGLQPDPHADPGSGSAPYRRHGRSARTTSRNEGSCSISRSGHRWGS